MSTEHLELAMLGFGCLVSKAKIACAVVGNSGLEAEALFYMNSMLMENYFQSVTDFSTEIRWLSCQNQDQCDSNRMGLKNSSSIIILHYNLQPAFTCLGLPRTTNCCFIRYS